MELDCYIKREIEKEISIDIINKKVSMIKQAMKIEEDLKREKELEKERKKLISKQNEAERIKNRKLFLDYIKDTYDISSFPKNFYIKLAEINNGTYRDMSEGISYEDLLFMFNRKQQYLNKINNKNNSIGKEIKGISRVNYDLAIIIGLYDEYKEWKRKKSMLQLSEEIEDKSVIKIDCKKINPVKSNDEEDILDILDDIY